MTKNKRKKRKRDKSPKPQAPTTLVKTKKKTSRNQLGSPGRKFPPAELRRRYIENILKQKAESRNPEELYFLGNFQMYEGVIADDDQKINEAVDSLIKASEVENHVWMSFLDLGWILLVRGLDAMALPYLKRATEECPDSRDAWTLRAWAHVGMGDRESAVACMESSTKCVDVTSFDLNLLDSLREGKDLSEMRGSLVLGYHGIEVTIPDSEEEMVEQLKCHLFVLTRVLEKDPDNLEILAPVGQFQYGARKLDEAEKTLSRYVELGGESGDAFTLLALIKGKTGDSRTALKFYRKAVSVDKDHWLANCNLASELQKLEKYEEARPYLEHVIENGKDSPYFPLALDLYGSNVGVLENDFKREAEYHQKAFRLDPALSFARVNYLVALCACGNLYELRKEFDRHIKYLKDSPEVHQTLGLLQGILAQGRTGKDFTFIAALVGDLIGVKASIPYLEKAWQNRDTIPSDERYETYVDIGQMAGQADLHSLALEVWDTGYQEFGDEQWLCNRPVDLVALGREEEAIKAARSLPMNQPRSRIILANTLNSLGLVDEAIEEYKRAWDEDEFLLLAYSNPAYRAISKQDEKLLDEVIERLKNREMSDVGSFTCLADLLLVRGKPLEVVKLLESHLLADDGNFITSKDLETLPDTSVLESGSDLPHKHYYILASAYLKLGEYTKLVTLYNWMNESEQQADVNWGVLMAEMLRSQNDISTALECAEKLGSFQPPLATASLCCLQQGNTERAIEFANTVLECHKQGTRFYHPQGNPEAVAHAVIAFAELLQGNLKTAKVAAKAAYEADPWSGFSSFALVRALEETGSKDEAIRIAERSLCLCPGSPEILSWLVEKYLEVDRLDEADTLLTNQQEFAVQEKEKSLFVWLSNRIARAKLKKQSDKAVPVFSWSEQLDPLCQDWLQILQVKNNTGSWAKVALVTHLGKIAERELFLRVFEPFKNHFLGSGKSAVDNNLYDLEEFIGGSRPPSLGGMARAFNRAQRRPQSRDTELLVSFRFFLQNIRWAGASKLRTREFADAVFSLARIRNTAAHISEPTESESDEALKLVVDDKAPGVILSALGITN